MAVLHDQQLAAGRLCPAAELPYSSQRKACVGRPPAPIFPSGSGEQRSPATFIDPTIAPEYRQRVIWDGIVKNYEAGLFAVA
jgi:hypothetical protein